MGICKERLVAQGLSQQQYGIDFLDTFSFVAKFNICLDSPLIAFSVNSVRNWYMTLPHFTPSLQVE